VFRFGKMIMSEAQYLNAVVERGKSFQVITEEYSPDAVKELMSHAPEAITLAPAGAVDATRLLARLRSLVPIQIKHSRAVATSHRWKCYLHEPRKENLQFCGVLEDEHKIPQKFEECLRKLDFSVLVLICVESVVDRMFAEFYRRDSAAKHDLWIDFFNVEPIGRDRVLESRLLLTSEAASSDRELLRDARRELLSRVATFTSEEIASGGDSISDNASQYALDLRSRGKVFGVRFGRTWHYPKFQFDAQRRAVQEMRAVLEALTPDPKGWDRLQWFVTPHERLQGRTPIEVWNSDRKKVIEAAKTEQWHGRRD